MHDCSCSSCWYTSSDRLVPSLGHTPCMRSQGYVPALALQAVLDLGYSVIWSDMDAVWLRDFQKLAPSSLDVVLVDDSEAEEERRSDNTGTGKSPPVLLGPCINNHTNSLYAIPSSRASPCCSRRAASSRTGSLRLPFAAGHAMTDIPSNVTLRGPRRRPLLAAAKFGFIMRHLTCRPDAPQSNREGQGLAERLAPGVSG